MNMTLASFPNLLLDVSSFIQELPVLSKDKLLNKLDESEPELATTQEDECVICVNAKATMETSPCGHRVVCRRCFVKTIQMAVSQRLLPLRCVICRAKILRLRHTPQPRAPLAPARLVSSKSWQATPPTGTGGVGAAAGARVPGSVSCYSVGARSVPPSASLYSVTSGESSLSGLSSVSSASGASGVTAACSGKLCAGSRCGGVCLGAVPRAPVPTHPRQPASAVLRRSQHHSMKLRLQEYAALGSYTDAASGGGSEASVVSGGGRLPPIREFQREFREGRRTASGGLQGTTSPASALPPPHTASAPAPLSVSTRIRCAQKIVTQLEISPQKKTQNLFRTPLRALNERSETQRARASESEAKSKSIELKPSKEDKKKETEGREGWEGSKKREESAENGKNEAAERKREEKARQKAEKEARSQAKREAKEAERLAKQKAKEEERQAKALAKEEKKKAKREAKLAAQAEKERAKNAPDSAPTAHIHSNR